MKTRLQSPQKWYSIAFVLIATALSIWIITSCTDKLEVTMKYTVMEPVYMSMDEVRSSLDIEQPKSIENPGNIYIYDHYVFINEPGNGIHVIDDQDPANPEVVSFIALPGNYNMAIRGDVLYADSYIDLVALDISDPIHIKEIDRIEGIFTQLMPEVMFDMEKGVVVGWQEKEVVEKSESDFSNGFPAYYYYGKNSYALQDMSMASSVLPSVSTQPATGIGGSMARFTIVNQHLYAIDDHRMQVFDISNMQAPITGQSVEIAWGIETIFPTNNTLFIGSQNGLYIYDITDPANPIFLSIYEHIRSCDPVVVEDNYAYVTLRGGSACWNNNSNQLDVVDISNLKQPMVVKSYMLSHPYGLGIDQGTLFICEGDAGLKVYNASDINHIDQNLITHLTGFDAFDVIPYNHTLFLIGTDGLYQFDYSNLKDIKLLSTLPVVRTETQK